MLFARRKLFIDDTYLLDLALGSLAYETYVTFQFFWALYERVQCTD